MLIDAYRTSTSCSVRRCDGIGRMRWMEYTDLSLQATILSSTRIAPSRNLLREPSTSPSHALASVTQVLKRLASLLVAVEVDAAALAAMRLVASEVWHHSLWQRSLVQHRRSALSYSRTKPQYHIARLDAVLRRICCTVTTIGQLGNGLTCDHSFPRP